MGEPTGRHVFCSNRAHFGNNALYSDLNRLEPLRKIQKKCARARNFLPRTSLLLSVAAALIACKPAAEAELPAAATKSLAVSRCSDGGQLQTTLYGAIPAQLEWGKNDLECTGMPRPEGRGARLRFAGELGMGEQQIAIIIAMPDLERGAKGTEFRSNVTLIEEGNGRFFSTSNLDNCLTDITSLLALDDIGDRYSIGGVLYCVLPLPEINGDSSVSIPELSFSGVIDWGSS